MPLTEIRESRAFVQEMKFLISPEQADGIREWSRANLAPDPHAGGASGDEYRVTSLYLDTDDLAVFERRGSYGRSKYRVRRYGESDRTFLERKLKTRNRVGKLRSIVGIGDIAKLEHAETSRKWAGHWFHQRVQMRALHPVCQISYNRMARMGVSNNGPIRLTVDQDIQAQLADRYAYSAVPGGIVLSPDHRILELKYKMEIPGLFKELMQAFNLRPQSSSKYRLAVAALELKLCLTS
jgi:hypothetical protein